MMNSRASTKPAIHFVGIGGIGMSALARYFKAMRWNVSGSDIVKSAITRSLEKDGIKVMIGHKGANIRSGTSLVVYNRAISKENPERGAAVARGAALVPYAEILGQLTAEYETIAITGSHGKSTTTSMAGLLLMKARLDPTILVGTTLKELGDRNLRIGKGRYLVLEADDFGGAFLSYFPSIAIVTNIDREHLDFYKNFTGLKNAFLGFLSRTRRGGTFILNRDDGNLYSLRGMIASIAKRNNITVIWYSLKDPAAKKIARHIAIPGEHNRSNAAAVYELGKRVGIPEQTILRAIGAYRGAWRRMELRGTAAIAGTRALVFDDYAHHPTEIKATLAAFREKYPHSPLVCIFQPHQAKRLHRLFNEFRDAFADADITFMLPLYKVAGRDEVVIRDSAALVRAMQKKHPKRKIFYLGDPHRLKIALRTLFAAQGPRRASTPPVIIMMGAGDIASITDKLITSSHVR